MRTKRANKRWLDADCPEGVLAIFDNGGKTLDRYTVMYVPEPGQGYVTYLGASENPFYHTGFGQHGELGLYEAREYRYACTSRKQSCRWSDLPEDVKRAVRQDLEV